MISHAHEIDLASHRDWVAKTLRRRAQRWTFDGRGDIGALQRHWRFVIDDALTGARIMFTRDTGMHTSGWFKNPEYERCFHLSISPALNMREGARAEGLIIPDHDDANERAWVRAFFAPESEKLLWFEPAVSKEGRAHGVRHWRLFCNAAWEPIHPRGEVYSTEFTEKGWKSWSEIPGRVIVSPLVPG